MKKQINYEPEEDFDQVITDMMMSYVQEILNNPLKQKIDILVGQKNGAALRELIKNIYKLCF